MRTILKYEGLTIGGVNVVKKVGPEIYSVLCDKGHKLQIPRHRLYRARSKGFVIKCDQCRPFPERVKSNAAWHRWSGMMKRAKKRGIQVSKRWLTFWNFYADMGVPPVGMVIDRINNLKGYSPENCRWATYKLSTENRRNTVWIRLNGKPVRVAELAKLANIPESRVYSRLASGWSVSQILNRRKFNGFFRTGKAINANAYAKKTF